MARSLLKLRTLIKRMSLALSAAAMLTGLAAVAQNGATDAPATTLRVDARLVVLDVMVTDAQGHAVNGLKLDDFKLRENGAEQTLKSLEDHTAMEATKAPPSPAFLPAVMPVGMYANRPKVQGNVWNVLVLDMLNTAMPDEARTRQQMRQFAKTLPPGVPVALVRLSASSPTIMVPFSADATGIETLLAGKALSPLSSPLRDVYNSDDDAAIESVYGKMAAAAKIPVDQLEDSQRETEMDRLTMRVILTLESLNSLAAWLEQYPGKKNLFWLSEGFPLTAQPQGFRNPNKVFNSARFRESYLEMQQRTDKRLETARVAVFPIDVRGVMSAATEGIDSVDVKDTLYGGPIGPARLNEDTLQADSRVNEERAGMMEIANATGGVATINRNDLAQVLSEKFRQGQTYYTLTYSPQDAKWDGRYRKIDLTVAKHGYRLYYRRGYFALDRKKAPATSADAFTLAMRHGAPEVSDLLFTAQLDRSVSGHVGLQYNIDARLLAFSESQDQRKAASIDCAVVEYDAAGKLLGSGEIRVDGRITSDQMTKLQTAGFPAHQDVPLMPGAKWLVVGVRDHTAGRFGTLQIPLDSQ